MLLEDIDFTDEDEARVIAQRAARTTDAGLEDYLALTAVGATYRPWAAAAGWLEAHPRWLESAEGASFRDLDKVLKGLRHQQSQADFALELEIPVTSSRQLHSVLTF